MNDKPKVTYNLKSSTETQYATIKIAQDKKIYCVELESGGEVATIMGDEKLVKFIISCIA